MSLCRRAYIPGDLPHLQATLAHWSVRAGTTGYCHSGDLAYRIATLSRHVPLSEQVQIWEQDEQIVALALCFRFEQTFEAYVRPEDRGGTVEQQVLAEAAAITTDMIRQFAPAQTMIGIDVHADDHHRKHCLTALGFGEYRQWDDLAERSLRIPPPPAVVPDGFTIRGVTPADTELLVATHNAAFNTTWSTDTYGEHILKQQSATPKQIPVVVAPDGLIAAFTVIWHDPITRRGLFEPVGTHPTFRRRGLARALMATALADMQTAGIHTTQIAFASDNQPARALYTSLGFQTRTITLGYQRTLFP